MAEEIVEVSTGAILRVTKRDTTREGIRVMDKLVEIEVFNQPSFIIDKDYLAEICNSVWAK